MTKWIFPHRTIGKNTKNSIFAFSKRFTCSIATDDKTNLASLTQPNKKKTQKKLLIFCSLAKWSKFMNSTEEKSHFLCLFVYTFSIWFMEALPQAQFSCLLTAKIKLSTANFVFAQCVLIFPHSFIDSCVVYGARIACFCAHMLVVIIIYRVMYADVRIQFWILFKLM